MPGHSLDAHIATHPQEVKSAEPTPSSMEELPATHPRNFLQHLHLATSSSSHPPTSKLISKYSRSTLHSPLALLIPQTSTIRVPHKDGPSMYPPRYQGSEIPARSGCDSQPTPKTSQLGQEILSVPESRDPQDWQKARDTFRGHLIELDHYAIRTRLGRERRVLRSGADERFKVMYICQQA
jgi:hypothetical protein